MKLTDVHRIVSSLSLIALMLVLVSCGGGGKSTSVDPNIPVITNLALALLTQSCAGTTGTGRVLRGTFDFTDGDGNLRGGAVQSTGKFDPSGTSIDLDFRIPGEVTITGTTAGSITFQACLRFAAQNSLTLSVAVVDATQKSSNVISARLDRPAGAPEAPRGATESFGPFR